MSKNLIPQIAQRRAHKAGRLVKEEVSKKRW